MIHENKEYEYRTNNPMGVLGGMLIGALAGAVTMLLIAPQAGKETRAQLQEKGIQLRDRTADMVENTVAQVRTKTKELSVGLKDRGAEMAVEQLDNVSEAAQAGKQAIRNS